MSNNSKWSAIALSVALVAAAGAAQAAPFVGKSSNEGYVKVGESDVTGGPHAAGNAGISVNSSGIDTQVDFRGLAAYSTKTNSTVDWNRDGTSDGTRLVHKLNFPYGGAPDSHDNLGVFVFAQVGSQDVWFGEWSAYGTSGDATRTVYYIGNGADTAVPTSGSATYSVVGINNYNASANGGNGNLLSGTFTANFAAGTLTGSIANGASGYAVNLGSATINSNASISGNTAFATQSGSLVASSGSVSGQFYGGQTALAGLVDFAGAQYDTAFGGTKN
ncbi:Slam-dependent surface lipoprotein [[Pseudomonas] boreopolis]|uniref:Transferrin-binding protein B C-lobe/N-lobe beta barrel domain-containing protein n=1 Tax=Xanthomonas boreopolis TaxID=86183 RepID=A0A919F6P6_9XANT|nr:hypothetical protein GCM10009090_08980 [[Pseudomonas] boreopolis]